MQARIVSRREASTFDCSTTESHPFGHALHTAGELLNFRRAFDRQILLLSGKGANEVGELVD